MQILWALGALATLFTFGTQTDLSAQQAPVVPVETAFKSKVLVSHEGTFHCDAAPQLLVGHSLNKMGSAAFTPITDRLSARFGTAVTPTVAEGKLPDSPFILIGLVKDHPALQKLVSENHADLPKEGLGPEGYVLDIRPTGVLIAAAKPAGAFYGALKLLERDTDTEKSLTVPAGTLVDWPTMGWRGMHFSLGSRESLPDVEKLITQVMPHCRLNQLIVELDYAFQFKSHPEVAEGNALSREDCQHLKALADKNFVHLIPMINCLGHQSWASHTAKLLTSHPEFDETPEVPADNKGIYCRSWCPLHPDINKLVFDLMDEMIDAFHADAFHVGMDEVFILGQCSRCKGQNPAKLFAKAVNDLHAHLVGTRKVQMLMWADRFLDGKATGYGEWEASENGTFPAIDLVPKDIILCDWHYENRYNDAPATYPSVPYFQKKGFHVWPSSWRSAENAQRLADCSLQNNSNKMVGYLSTTWMDVAGIVRGLTPGATVSGNKEIDGVAAATRTGSRIAWEGDATTR